MTILKQAAPSSGVTDVRYRHYRGRGYYGNPGAAIGLGILGAAAGAAALGPMGPMGPAIMGRATTRQATTAPPIPIAAATTIGIKDTISVVWT